MLPCLPLKIERVFGYARISVDEAIGLLLQDRRRIGPSGHTHIISCIDMQAQT